jgi:hypothetical protein
MSALKQGRVAFSAAGRGGTSWSGASIIRVRCGPGSLGGCSEARWSAGGPVVLANKRFQQNARSYNDLEAQSVC